MTVRGLVALVAVAVFIAVAVIVVVVAGCMLVAVTVAEPVAVTVALVVITVTGSVLVAVAGSMFVAVSGLSVAVLSRRIGSIPAVIDLAKMADNLGFGLSLGGGLRRWCSQGHTHGSHEDQILKAEHAQGLVSQDLDPTQLASQCLFDDVYQCKRVSDELKEHCDCPCLPKCCPPDHHVITSPDARHHGIECVESPEALALPRVNIVGHVNESESEPKPRFYHSVLPFCRAFTRKASAKWEDRMVESGFGFRLRLIHVAHDIHAGQGQGLRTLHAFDAMMPGIGRGDHMSYAFPSTAFQTCEELPDRTLFKDSDDFHIGPNGKVHFTDAHGHVDKLQDYCVDQYYKKPLASSDTSQYLSDYVYYDYGNETTEEIEEDRELKMLANHDCHKMDSKPHSMDIMYCKDNIIQIRKCCPKGTILNLRSRACTNEVQKEWGEFIIYRKIGGEFDPFPSNHTNLFPSVIFNMNTKNLYVTESDDYKLLNDESLFYGGKFYHPGQYCLDYSINYCESGSTNLTIRAIVDDALLRQKGASTIFGTNKEDSRISLIIKQVGYPLSIAALILTLLTFLVVPDLRKTTTLQKLKDQFRSKTQRTSSNVRQTAGSRDTVTRGGSSLASNVSYNFDRAALKLNGQLTRASSLDSDMPVVDLNE
eukprot:maker-scaffold269_size230758-snap-gene-1.37 protein:Tk08006 transcript:maker-scaffold269_size230758-snap-gene-1.37-mRNA-1 annotation:"related to histone acetyltransferase 3"